MFGRVRRQFMDGHPDRQRHIARQRDLGSAKPDPRPLGVVVVTQFLHQDVVQHRLLPVVLGQQIVCPAQRDDALREGGIEGFDARGGPGRGPEEALNGRQRVLHPVIEFADEKRLPFRRPFALRKMCPSLDLPAPRAVGEPDRHDQGGGVERPFQQAHVAEQFGQRDIRFAAPERQHDEGKIRPGRLPSDPIG